MDTIVKRIQEFVSSDSVQNLTEYHNAWLGCPNKPIVTNLVQLEKMGENELGIGVNCSEYAKVSQNKLTRHINFQENLFKRLTNLDPSVLQFPNGLGIRGKSDDKNVIPVTAYRLGYYYSHIYQIAKSNPTKRLSVLEIGGGFGALCYITQKNLQVLSRYTIIDIPSALVNIAYVLGTYGISFRFWNEPANGETIVLGIPTDIENITECDIVISTACLPELPTRIIDYYLANIVRINPDYVYVDYTNACNGVYLGNQMQKVFDQRFKLILDQVTPINCYMCPYFDDESYGMQETVKEKMFSKAN